LAGNSSRDFKILKSLKIRFKYGATTLSITIKNATLIIMTLSITIKNATLIVLTLSITLKNGTLSIMTFSIKAK